MTGAEARVRVVCRQMAPVVGAPAENMRATRHAVSDALAMEADLIVLPELAASGCVFGDIEEVRSAALTRRAGIFGEWQELVAPRDAVVVGGFPE